MALPVHESVVIAASGTDEKNVQVPVLADVAVGKLVVVSTANNPGVSVTAVTDSQSNSYTRLTHAVGFGGGEEIALWGALLDRSLVGSTDWIKASCLQVTYLAADSFFGVAAPSSVYAVDSEAGTTASYFTPTVHAGDLVLAVCFGAATSAPAPGWTQTQYNLAWGEDQYIVPNGNGAQGPLAGDLIAVCALKGHGAGLTMLV